MECPLWRLLISSQSVSKHGHHIQFLFLMGRFLKNVIFWNYLAIWTETWLEASTCMVGSVLSFLKAEWKVRDTGSTHWASSFNKNLTWLMREYMYLWYLCLKLTLELGIPLLMKCWPKNGAKNPFLKCRNENWVSPIIVPSPNG